METGASWGKTGGFSEEFRQLLDLGVEEGYTGSRALDREDRVRGAAEVHGSFSERHDGVMQVEPVNSQDDGLSDGHFFVGEDEGVDRVIGPGDEDGHVSCVPPLPPTQ